VRPEAPGPVVNPLASVEDVECPDVAGTFAGQFREVEFIRFQVVERLGDQLPGPDGLGNGLVGVVSAIVPGPVVGSDDVVVYVRFPFETLAK
jgi:hypothetical protein